MKGRDACSTLCRFVAALTLASGAGSGCADRGGLTIGRDEPGSAPIGRATYDWQGHGFEEPWPYGPLRNDSNPGNR